MSDLGSWDPLSPDDTATVLAGLSPPWWLAGGWAIELAVGRSFRAHADTDVLVLRPHLLAVQRHLAGWDLYAADPPGTLRPWRPGEELPVAVHDIWCRRTPGSPWRFQLMVDEVDDGDWAFRRDGRVRRPLATLTGSASRSGLPVLAPEIQLLYKSGAGRPEAGPRPKDEQDLDAIVPVLDDESRAWLASVLSLVAPDNRWLARLS